MKNKVIKYSITLVFLLLPVIDILRITAIKDVEIFNISIIELVNIVLISLSFIVTMIKIKFKFNKKVIIYFIFLMIYLIFHCLNIYKFNVNLYTDANPNFFIELYYVFRVYMLPILLIIVLLKNKDIFNKQYYLATTKYLICVISGIIVISNMLRFSYSSYAINKYNEYAINNTNFFDVFKYKEGFRKLLTCGFFPSANQISIILIMLLPINIYNLYTTKKVTSGLLTVLQAFSMIIVGTKVASFGSLIIIIGAFILYLFFVLFFRESINKKYILIYISIIFFVCTMFTISPFRQLMKTGVSITSGITNNSGKDKEEEKFIYSGLDTEMTDQEFSKYLYDNNGTFKISSIFYEMYPIEKDRSFWLKMARRDKKLNNDYRIIKKDIINRIFERNENKYDYLLGLGYSINFLDIERDYVYQYYLFGILGLCFLLGPYITIYMYNVIKAFNKRNFKYGYCLSLVSSLFGLILCYFSGHLFGWVSPMIILATTLCIQKEENGKNES